MVSRYASDWSNVAVEDLLRVRFRLKGRELARVKAANQSQVWHEINIVHGACARHEAGRSTPKKPSAACTQAVTAMRCFSNHTLLASGFLIIYKTRSKSHFRKSPKAAIKPRHRDAVPVIWHRTPGHGLSRDKWQAIELGPQVPKALSAGQQWSKGSWLGLLHGRFG